MSKPVSRMTRKELAAEVEHMAGIISKDGIGHNIYSKARAISIIRELVKRIPRGKPTLRKTDAGPS